MESDLNLRLTKEIPPLTLDQKWHKLFGSRKNPRLMILEKTLNDLLKLQGKLNTEYKEYGLLKKKLMNDILGEMGDAFDGQDEVKRKGMATQKNYIEKINQTLAKYEKKLAVLPKEIQSANLQLLNASMSLAYKEIKQKTRKQESLDHKIMKLRTQLTELTIEHTESKQLLEDYYGYMHDLVGAEVIEEFDRIYLGGKV